MPKNDYLARDDEGRAEQFILFRDNIGQFLVPLGISPTDEDIVQQALDATRFRAMVDFQLTMQQAAVSWTNEKNYERDGAGNAPTGQNVPVLPKDFPAPVPPGIAAFVQSIKSAVKIFWPDLLARHHQKKSRGIQSLGHPATGPTPKFTGKLTGNTRSRWSSAM